MHPDGPVRPDGSEHTGGSGSDGTGTPETSHTDAEATEKWRRQRRIDEIFGDDLPRDDRKPSEKCHSGKGRSWYEENRPPHHG